MIFEEKELRDLICISDRMKENAYAPYSHFPVGAALLCEDGSVVTGCNVENAAYPLGVCAEKTAIVKAVSEGHRKFKAIVVSSNLKERFIVPCGSCRQTLAEFGMDWDVFMTKPDGSYLNMKVRELLPLGFSPEQLQEPRVEGKEEVSTDVIPVADGHNMAAKIHLNGYEN